MLVFHPTTEVTALANHIAHFEIFADNVERARKFYEQVFAWRFEPGGPPDFYHIFTGPPVEHGIARGLIARRQGPASQGAINGYRCTISVVSIREFADTEGNIACAMQYADMTWAASNH